MDIALAILCGLIYFIGTNRVCYTLATTLGSGLFMGFVVGLYFGDVAQGMIIGGSIQLVYLGVVYTGGNVPADNALAAIIALPVALTSGIDAQAAVAIAVPFGVLGAFLDQIRRISNSVWVRMGDKYAEQGDEKGLWRCAFVYPELMTFVLRFIPVFLLVLLGTDAIAGLLNYLPQWILTGFSVAGGILPAMGFAIIILTIGKPKLMPYFFLGFFAVAYLGIPTMAAAVFGACIAVLVALGTNKDAVTTPLMSESAEDVDADKGKHLTNSDLNRAFLRWWLTTELSNSYDRLQGLMFGNSISLALKKLYGDDAEGYKEALVRNVEFYNSEGVMGTVIQGITLSMEEEKANGAPVPGSAITGIKTGLMGPIAGIGDTLIHGTLSPVILGVACTFALQGSPVGAVIPFAYNVICIIVAIFMLRFGYRLGRESVMKLMKSGMINKIIEGASIMGLFMMGALGSTYVKVSTPLQFVVDNAEPIVVQEILDQLLVGLLPLAAIMGIWWYFTHKGANYNKIIVIILVVSMVCAFFGILA